MKHLRNFNREEEKQKGVEEGETGQSTFQG